MVEGTNDACYVVWVSLENNHENISKFFFTKILSKLDAAVRMNCSLNFFHDLEYQACSCIWKNQSHKIKLFVTIPTYEMSEQS